MTTGYKLVSLVGEHGEVSMFVSMAALADGRYAVAREGGIRQEHEFWS